jgi:hypothetical protein
MTAIHDRKMGTLLNPLQMEHFMVNHIMENQGVSKSVAQWIFVRTYVRGNGGLSGALRRKQEKADESLVAVPVRLLPEFESWYDKILHGKASDGSSVSGNPNTGIEKGFKVRATGSMMMRDQLAVFKQSNPAMASKFATIDEDEDSQDSSHANEDSDVVASDSDHPDEEEHSMSLKEEEAFFAIPE